MDRHKMTSAISHAFFGDNVVIISKTPDMSGKAFQMCIEKCRDLGIDAKVIQSHGNLYIGEGSITFKYDRLQSLIGTNWDFAIHDYRKE